MLSEINALNIGKACCLLGGGRTKKESAINPSVGVELLKSVGEKLRKDEVWAVVHHSEKILSPQIKALMDSSLVVKSGSETNRKKFNMYVFE